MSYKLSRTEDGEEFKKKERKKQEIKDEGHFIGLMTLGDTVKKKSRIQKGRDGEAKKKGLKHSSVWVHAYVEQISAFMSGSYLCIKPFCQSCCLLFTR